MANTPISPKVTAAASVGGIVGLFLSFANSATPEMFDGLGKWGYPAFLAVTLGAALVAAFLKSDPLRDSGAAAKQDAMDRLDALAKSAAALHAAYPAPASTDTAPASTFPKAAVDAAVAAAEPAPAVEVTPVYTAPAAPVAPVA